MNILSRKDDIWRKTILWLPLAAVCIAAVLLSLPTINNNINDPNMIVYFNTDEGGRMDTAWYYYRGEKRDSFQWDYDYGLEMLYVADFARIILDRFIEFTPGTFVLIFRWLHLIAWVCALIAMWYLVGHHFGNGWQKNLAVFLLGVRPAFSNFSNTLKPDPIVLLFIIIGLHYALQIIKGSSWKYLVLAVAMATLAFLVKFAGLFLLPALVASMYFAEYYQNPANKKKKIFPDIRIAWTLPMLLGVVLIALESAAILFYVRKSTGHTWYEQFGFWGSLSQSNSMRCLFFIGASFFVLSFGILAVNSVRRGIVKKIAEFINTVNSYGFIVCSLFLAFLLVFGFRWVITPKYFLLTYSYIPSASYMEAVHLLQEGNFIIAFLKNLIQKLTALDFIIFLFFIFYVIMEVHLFRRNMREQPLKLFKRLTLFAFFLPSFIFMFSGLRLDRQHMLPFFVAMSILAMQGIGMFNATFNGKKLLKNCILSLIGVVFLVDIMANGLVIVKSRIYQFHQNEDVAFDIKRWWRGNIPMDASIVTEHYNRVYIPSGYKNVKTLNWNQRGKVEQLRQLVDIYHPQFIYFNETTYDEQPLTPIEEVLSGKKLMLIKSFDNSGKRYQRWLGSNFVIYKILN